MITSPTIKIVAVMSDATSHMATSEVEKSMNDEVDSAADTEHLERLRLDYGVRSSYFPLSTIAVLTMPVHMDLIKRPFKPIQLVESPQDTHRNNLLVWPTHSNHVR
jgi:hypothetical protein